MASLRDVARKSGVSVATVSNVLHGKDDRVSPSTRERVLDAVRQLRYRPTQFEEGGETTTRNLGLLVLDMTMRPLENTYLAATLNGLMEVGFSNGFTTTVFASKMWLENGLSLRRSYDGRCDGLLISAPRRGNEVIGPLRDRGVPMVIVGSPSEYPDISSFDVDNEAIGRAAARKFIELGHRRVAWFGSREDAYSSQERRVAFEDEIARSGVPCEIHSTICDSPTMGVREQFRNAFLLGDPASRPTAYFCWNDDFATQAIRALSDAGLRVPEDASVLGVDGTTHVQATFVQDPFQISREAAMHLIELIRNPDLTPISPRYPAYLRVGNTLGPPPES